MRLELPAGGVRTSNSESLVEVIFRNLIPLREFTTLPSSSSYSSSYSLLLLLLLLFHYSIVLGPDKIV
jgi:hypothetical protein